MPIYMDRHYVEGATAHAVAIAHSADLAVQDEYRVRFLTYWSTMSGPRPSVWSTRRTGNHQASPPGVARPGPRTRSSRSTLL
jgi:hypothetical protein